MSVVNAGPGPSLINVNKPKMAMKTKATILMATMMTPKLAPIVLEAIFKMVTPRMAMIAVICYEFKSTQEGKWAYLESPLWDNSLWVGRESMVHHPIDVLADCQL